MPPRFGFTLLGLALAGHTGYVLSQCGLLAGVLNACALSFLGWAVISQHARQQPLENDADELGRPR